MPPSRPKTDWMKRRLEDAAVDEVRRRVEVAGVVTLHLEPRSVVGAGFEDVADFLERVAEHAVFGAFEIRPFPVVLELLVPAEHGVQAEVHRTHVQRGHLRLELERGLQALVHQHVRRAAGGEVDHHVGARRNRWKERAE
jgi:hypothetical protein